MSKHNERLVLDLLASVAPGRMLDIPSGGGPVVDAARAAGWNVIEVDLFPRDGMRGVQADACAPLPFADASFDALVSMEGIEHFEDQTGFLRECARVLKPGGLLVLTTPNVLHLSARCSQLLTAQRQLQQGFINEDATLRARLGRRLYHGHAFLIDVFRLRYILRIVGMRVRGLHSCALSGTSIALAPLALPIWAATSFSLSASRRRLRKAGRRAVGADVEQELSTLARSSALLFSRKLVVSAIREPAPLV